ncbi:class I SAM-dependent methyltransferase [Amycolatopsis minnesotensis]|uniref:Class I SAM-dependent methyltransferase n=1 Tax=Amycolatopsis minnesotensis TaxID=337894 RepID=A0ABP5CEX2_9PSEU
MDFTGVQSTMLVTLFLKALDAEETEPVLGDRFAAEAVDRIDYDWAKLDKPTITRNRFGLALRTRQIDDWTADFLRRNPDATVLHLACGLDARAFRLDLPDGVRWFDVDLPDVIALRRELYEDADGYRMIGASVTGEDWLAEIPAGKPVFVIAEGLLMYLHEAEVWQLLGRLTEHFGTGELVFDGVLPWVAKLTQVLKKYLNRWYDYPAYWTPIRDGSDIARWNPRLLYRDHVALVAQYDRIPDRKLQRAYRLMSRFGPVRNYLRVFRADF